MMDLVRGVKAPAWVVGFARGIAEAAVMAGLVFVGAWAFSADAPTWLQQWAPLVLIGVRGAEGIVDHIDPAKRRAPDA